MSSALRRAVRKDVLKDYGEKVNPRIFVLLHHKLSHIQGTKQNVNILFDLDLTALTTNNKMVNKDEIDERDILKIRTLAKSSALKIIRSHI